MLLAPFNSSTNVFTKKKKRFSAVALCLSSSLNLPQASFPHQDQTAFAFLSAGSGNNPQALLLHLPLQAAQYPVNPTACVFSFPRLPNLICQNANLRFCCHFFSVYNQFNPFVWVGFCFGLVFLSCFHQIFFSFYLISVSDCTNVTKITSIFKITKISLLTTVLSPV